MGAGPGRPFAESIGLDPHGQSDGPIAYWGTNDIAAKVQELVGAGATVAQDVKDVGGGLLSPGLQLRAAYQEALQHRLGHRTAHRAERQRHRLETEQGPHLARRCIAGGICTLTTRFIFADSI